MQRPVIIDTICEASLLDQYNTYFVSFMLNLDHIYLECIQFLTQAFHIQVTPRLGKVFLTLSAHLFHIFLESSCAQAKIL